MVKTRFDDVTPMALINALAEKSAARGCSRGIGRGRSRVRGRGKLTPTRHMVLVKSALQNKESPIHHNE